MSVNVDLDQLKHFVAVGEELHFTRAAQNRLHVSQPWLSRSVRGLEEKLGVQLFNRHSRHVELTDAGRRMLYGARKVIHDFDRTVWSVMGDRRGNSQLTVGYSVYVDLRFMTELKEMTVAENRTTIVSFESSSCEETATRIRKRELDCGVVNLPVDTSNLECVPLFRLPLAAAMRKTHRLARKRVLTLEDLRDENLILGGKQREMRFREWLLRRFSEAGILPKVAKEAASPHEAQYLVSHGFGIALANSGAFRTSPEGVVVKIFPSSSVEVETVVLFRREKPSVSLAAFIARLKQLARSNRNERRPVLVA